MAKLQTGNPIMKIFFSIYLFFVLSFSSYGSQQSHDQKFVECPFSIQFDVTPPTGWQHSSPGPVAGVNEVLVNKSNPDAPLLVCVYGGQQGDFKNSLDTIYTPAPTGYDCVTSNAPVSGFVCSK